MELSAVNALLTFIILCGVANIGKYQGIRKAKVGTYVGAPCVEILRYSYLGCLCFEK